MEKQVVNIKTMEKLSPLFRGKNGPGLAKGAMHLFAIDKINDLCERSSGYTGADFAAGLLSNLGVHYKIGNIERLKHLPEGAFITISNHPYGGLDGIMLIDLMACIRPDYKLMVNSILSLVKGMNGNFISVNPVTDKKEIDSTNLNGIRTTIKSLQGGHPVGFFPSGAVSNFKLKEMRLKDREWQESILKLIQAARVPVVPIHFLDGNSPFFYFLGLINWRIRTLRLPYEIFNKSKQKPRIAIGNIITVEEQQQYKDLKSYGSFLRKSVYEMPEPTTYTNRIIVDMKDV
jgi:putative hemolysin